MVDLTWPTDVIRYSLERSVFGRSEKVKFYVKKSLESNLDVGTDITITAYGTKIFVGTIRFKNKKAGVIEFIAYGESDIFYRTYVREIIYPSTVGETDDMDISQVVKYLVDNYSDLSFTYPGSIVESGTRITKFVVNEYISNALDRLGKAVGYVWLVEDGTFYFKEPEYANSSVTLTNSDGVFSQWTKKTDRLVNELHLICAPQEYSKSDFFRGDGTTKEFRLSYIPSGSIRVFIDGVEQSRDAYEIDYDVPSIIFDTAPPYYNPSGDSLANEYPDWTWRRKITVTVSSSATPSSLTEPIILLAIDDSDLDWENVNGDYSDIRFAYTDGTNVTEFSHSYVGSYGTTRYFLVKLSGVTLNAGDTYEFYILYGNSEATDKPVSVGSLTTEYDVWNYSGSPNTSKWTQHDSYLSCDESICGTRTNCTLVDPATIYSDYTVSTSGYLRIALTSYAVLSDKYREYYLKLISNTLADEYSWVYYNYADSPRFVRNAKSITLSYTGIYSDACGYDPTGSSVYRRGVWYFKEFNPVPTISVGDRELNASYNVEIRYAFRAPIYVKISNVDSQETYGLYSKVIRANWITTVDMAQLLASRYISQYSLPLYETEIKMPTKRYIDYGLRAGYKVEVDDIIHNVSGTYVIYSEKIKDDYTTIKIGSEAFNVFEWGAKVEERIRQLETSGDENFFTP